MYLFICLGIGSRDYRSRRVQNLLVGDPARIESNEVLLQPPLWLWEGQSFVLFRPPRDWARPTYLEEDLLPVNVISLKTAQRQTHSDICQSIGTTWCDICLSIGATWCR